MKATVEGVDPELLEEARQLLGTELARDTVNEALREFVRRRLAAKLLDDLSQRDPEVLERLRAEAWR